ncbi:NADH-quinone oxidoreductase subunit NuoH [Cellulomonas dongxiuzhuiae]|uniref:NADH-quinone oxidoreductase subunit H n=1 Tax=Cellulomonas dongxiuzhuiae TaxID=2819979 RepID=A0ABX8GID3_9CELL|nr:NADH-quinone oxidoreductase subunit NuoH [Cellulomonas dongxiuzhuiae]MBO3088408.1 NADH-quinone oxidoreductase subunit NuoH [Cellulomonas dongxiuzhuiae]MBO3094258.1 NADH-quinone oxidoreductase subunit NuoH [Cellulomonas dongxiuzhuiae]QWC15306.1 NADH-quinone oxidoreductase subunit NuoH [Cellulomonas dongxiuzhuiae]
MSGLATALGALPSAVGDGTVGAVSADFSQDVFWVWLLKAVAIIVFLLTSVLIAIWFERRVVGRMQLRPGPNVHGPLGLLQSLADAMKLLVKEDVTVRAADKLVYILAPMIAVLCSLLVYAVIPFGPEVSIFGVVTPLQLTDFSVAVLYILACAAVGVYGIVLGGWSSNSTYPLLGGVRSTAQVISYELAMGLSLVSVFIMAGSMSTSQIVNSQTQMWWFLPLLPAFVIYVISMVGETNRLPFDLPEAEGELVGGYTTEYSSMKFAWFFLAEYINMLNVSAVATTLFFGGWRAPWPISAINDGMFNTGWWPVLWFVAKVWLFMFLFVWIRGSVLRFRYDQFMKIGWKILIPAALVWVVCVTLVQAARQLWDVDLRTLLFGLAGVVVVGLVLSFLVPEKKPEPAPEPTEPQDFDPFADGYPVPPLPGQVLPPSPRAQRRLAATAADDPSEPETPLEVRGG